MSRKRSKRVMQQDNEFLNDVIRYNQLAFQEGPKKKRWTPHDMISIQPKTIPQSLMLEAFAEGKHVFAYGSAGSGKTILALLIAFNEYFRKGKDIIIIRSIVETRSIGFLPGSKEEKIEPYEAPYRDLVNFLFHNPATYDSMKESGLIRFIPTSFVRGITLNGDGQNGATIIFDEAQNCSESEIDSVLTRVGEYSRVIALGDGRQTDLNKHKNDQSGFDRLIQTFKRMASVESIEFHKQDIVRSGFCKDYLIATESL